MIYQQLQTSFQLPDFMEFNVNDLLKASNSFNYYCKKGIFQVTDKDKIFLIINKYRNKDENEIFELISQETGHVSEWSNFSINFLFNKIL